MLKKTISSYIEKEEDVNEGKAHNYTHRQHSYKLYSTIKMKTREQKTKLKYTKSNTVALRSTYNIVMQMDILNVWTTLLISHTLHAS